MDIFNQSAIERILGTEGKACVSVFMPTFVAGKEAEQDAIRLKNLLDEAEYQLANRVKHRESKAMLEAGRSVPENADIWNHRDRGLAVFLADGVCEVFRTPFALPESVHVGNHFRFRPLLPALEKNDNFYVLTLSQHNPALYRSRAQAIEPVEVDRMPANLRTALNLDTPDRSGQLHTTERVAVGKTATAFHGHAEVDTTKQQLEKYFRLVDQAVVNSIGKATTGRDASPLLVLACVDSMVPIYQQINSYPNLAPVHVSGNVERLDLTQLFQQAHRAAAESLGQPVQQALADFNDHAQTERTLDEPCEIVLAALQGRVFTLFYDPQANLFGKYDDKTAAVEVTGKTSDDDLIDLAAVATLKNHGTVYSMLGHAISTNSPLAAVLRYS